MKIGIIYMLHILQYLLPQLFLTEYFELYGLYVSDWIMEAYTIKTSLPGGNGYNLKSGVYVRLVKDY